MMAIKEQKAANSAQLSITAIKSRGNNNKSINDANENFLQQAGLLRHKVAEMKTTALEQASSLRSGYKSFDKDNFATPYTDRDELLSRATVDLTPEEEILLTEALDKDRPLRELECLQRERKLQLQLAALQGELVVAKQSTEDTVRQLLPEMQIKLDLIQTENANLTESLATLQNSNTDLQISHEKLQQNIEKRFHLPVVSGDFKSKVA